MAANNKMESQQVAGDDAAEGKSSSSEHQIISKSSMNQKNQVDALTATSCQRETNNNISCSASSVDEQPNESNATKFKGRKSPTRRNSENNDTSASSTASEQQEESLPSSAGCYDDAAANVKDTAADYDHDDAESSAMTDRQHTVIEICSQRRQKEEEEDGDESRSLRNRVSVAALPPGQPKTTPEVADTVQESRLGGELEKPEQSGVIAACEATTTRSNQNSINRNQAPQNDNNPTSNNYPPVESSQQNRSFIPLTSSGGGKRQSDYEDQLPTGTNNSAEAFCKRRRLSFLQSLLLRKWPYLALTICLMSSLIFGMLLSALTVYLMQSSGLSGGDCSALAAAAAAAAKRASSSPLLAPHEFDTPIELASLTGGAESGGRQHYAANLLESAAAGKLAERPSFQRLPTALSPIHYDLFVQPYIAEPFNFTGKVSIRIKCLEATDNITLHTNDLQLDEKTLSLSGNGSTSTVMPKVKGLSQDKQLQYSIIQLDSQLEAGQEYVLGIDFVGSLNDDLAGFYKIRFERQNSNETTWIAATQFQATDARRAFPCFDEPYYKATFSIQIKHWKNMTALSNMPIIDRQDSPDGLWVTDTFGKSQRMSTYLVAYAVTNFESRSEGNISVWTRPGFAHTAEYALKIAGKILRHYEDFFGIAYPLPKMDMIALPDFNAGAMENWGLITYRETAMLYDDASSSIANKQRVAVVVAHELAHQWFGNLVTPKWWDDLWLNEGFASYVEYIGVDHVEPKWRMLEQFVVEEVQNVFRMDGLSSSHQISIPVNNPDEISEIFDHISYAKGASIIRMMNHFLTERVFKSGLRRYLMALKYNSAEQSDLWTHLTEASRLLSAEGNSSSLAAPVDVEKVMNSWTLQTGFPLVTLQRKYDGSGKAQLSQERYMSYKSAAALAKNKSMAAQRWEIPITFTSKSEQNWQPTTRLWMHQNDSQPVELDRSLVPQADTDWMLLNVQQVGYYRVNYDQQNWKLLIDQLNSDHRLISSTNRAQILDDIFELARGGVIDYKMAMEATRYLKSEHDYLPWDTVFMAFSHIDDMLQRTPIYGDWRDYIADLIEPYYARYKDTEWSARNKNTTAQTTGLSKPIKEDEQENDVLEQYNQVNAIAWACQVNDHCIQKAKSLFENWRSSGKNLINPALRYTIYCTAIENGNKDDWNFLWRTYEQEQNASEKDRILRALGCSKELWVLSRYLEWTFSKQSKPTIRRQDGAYVFRTIAKNNYGRDLAFNFMREKWSTIKEHYGKTSFSMGSLIRSIAGSMNTQTELNQLLAFYESIKSDVGSGKRAFQIAIEEAESNVVWRNRNYKILEDWIQEARSKVTSS